jgi:hydrogenase maturation protease
MTAPPGARKVLVACLGNPDRGDDGVGVLVSRELAGRLPAGATLLVRSGDMAALIEDFAGYDGFICVDAAASMGTPGRVHRVDTAIEELPRELVSASSHGFGLAGAIALARTIGRAPEHIVIYAIEGRDFSTGAPVCPEAAAAASVAAASVAAEAWRILGEL